jgi:hypothetical protein
MSNDLIKSWLFDAALNDTDLVPETLLGFAKFVVQMGDAVAAKVLQFHLLQVVPDSLSTLLVPLITVLYCEILLPEKVRERPISSFSRPTIRMFSASPLLKSHSWHNFLLIALISEA